VAVNRRGKGKDGETQADFINVTAWRGLAEFITRHFRKGSSICVVGAIRTRSWTDPQGQKHYATEVVADEAYFVDSRADSQPAGQDYMAAQYQQMGQAVNSGQAAPMYEEIAGDEDLPF
jgi:single-strand DNA-binding protein